jgi:hypothetical protein
MATKLLRFDILTTTEDMHEKHKATPVLFNVDHVVSIKPIAMSVGPKLIKGYWIRLSNGKKYRALSIPNDLKKMLDGAQKSLHELPQETEILDADEDTLTLQ